MNKRPGFHQHEDPYLSLVLLSAPLATARIKQSSALENPPCVWCACCARSRNSGRLHLWLVLRAICVPVGLPGGACEQASDGRNGREGKLELFALWNEVTRRQLVC
ncbi:hypothetical protein V8C42DRAFT_266964 [Trichoderma barbatum]